METKIDKVAPNVTFCPDSKKVFTTASSTRVTWIEPTFTDDVKVVLISRSHAPGQVFEWGDHVVTYVAKDAFDNTATCVFELYVTPFKCEQIQTPIHATGVRGTWKWGQIYDYKCQANYQVAVPKHPFYACGRMGTWNHGPPTYPNNPNNLVPACTRTSPSFNSATNKFTYTTTQCTDQLVNELKQEFIKLINKLHTLHKICGEKDCNFANIKITENCRNRSPSQRKRRETMLNNNLITISFENVDIETQQQQELQKLIKKTPNDFTLNLNGRSVDLSGSEIEEPKLTCKPGSVLDAGVCVACSTGMFEKEGICTNCEMGSYSGENSTSCTKCPGGMTTLGVASSSFEQCIKDCSAGEFYESNIKHCTKCPIGFYNDGKQQTCLPCDKGLSTKYEGATSKDKCSRKCLLGYELVGQRCQLCENGYYRNNESQTACVPCPIGKTTYGLGNRDGRCKVICPAGEEIQKNNDNVCQKCDVGYYNDDVMAVKCKRCYKYGWTKGLGTANGESCLPLNGSAIFSAVIKFTELKYKDGMNDSSTAVYRQMAEVVNKAVLKVYEDKKDNLNSVRINKLQPGSVVADVDMKFDGSYKGDILKPLRDAANNGNIGGLPVDSKQFSIDGCRYLRCGENKQCIFTSINMTRPICVCQQGFYGSKDGGTCYADCIPGYCQNNGACERGEKGRVCRCPKDYSGERCQNKNNEGGKHVGLIVGVVMGILLFIVIVLYCLKQHAKSNQNTWKERPLTDEIEVNGHPLTDMSSTPIVIRIPEPEDYPLSYENKGAELEDGKPVVRVVNDDSPMDRQTSEVTVFVKPKPYSSVNEIQVKFK